MFVSAIGTAVPERCYTKSECWQAFTASEWFDRLDARAHAVAKLVLSRNNGIERRFLAVDALNDVFAIDPDTLQRRFAAHAPRLAAAAGRKCVGSRGTVSAIHRRRGGQHVHGISLPGSKQLRRGATCICRKTYCATTWWVRGAPARCRIGSYRRRCWAPISANTFYPFAWKCAAPPCISTMIPACSSAHACLATAPGPPCCPSAAPSGGAPSNGATRYHSRIPPNATPCDSSIEAGMLRNVLTRAVPRLAAEHAHEVLDTALGRAGLKRHQVSTWIMHAGGRDVLLALQDRLGLTAPALAYSRDALRQFGNLSSAFVYFVLDAAMADGAPGGWWWMSSFGAGFTCHGALLAVD